jgi:hypothetical protein
MRRPTRNSIAEIDAGEIQPDEARRADDTAGELISFVEAWGAPARRGVQAMKRAKRLSLEITFYVVRSGNEQFTAQGADAFGEVPRLQVGAQDRPLRAGLKRNVLQAQTSSPSEFIRQDCAAGKERREKFGVCT